MNNYPTPISKAKDLPLSYLYTILIILLVPVALLNIARLCIVEVYRDNRGFLADLRKAPSQFRKEEASRRAYRQYRRNKGLV